MTAVNKPESVARTVARDAMRREMARAAIQLVFEAGYDEVTLHDLAAASGVSRSTFVRYLGGKDAAVLEAVVLERDRVVEELSRRPESEQPWVALRRAFDTMMDRGDTATRLALLRLVFATPDLAAGLFERETTWRAELVAVLEKRKNRPDSPVAIEAVAAAAIGCLAAAMREWAATDAAKPLAELLDTAFVALAPIA